MKNKLSFVAIILLFILPKALFASDTTKVWKDILADFKSSTLQVKWINAPVSKIIGEVEVLDARVDTTHIGVFTPRTGFLNPTKWIFSNNETLAKVLSHKLSGDYNKNNRLLLVVRDFWLTDNFAQSVAEKREANRPIVQAAKLTMKVDLYIQQGDTYQPLVRIDTAIWSRVAITKSAYEISDTALTIITQKSEQVITTGIYIKRKPVTLNAIMQQYMTGNTPSAFENKKPIKGIYYTFTQFLQNQPVLEAFQVYPYNHQLSLLYGVNEIGDQYLKHNVWGVFDGDHYYIMQDGNLFKLYFEGKAMYWMGLKNYAIKLRGIPAIIPLGGGLLSYGTVSTSVKVDLQLTPYLLNYATGLHY